MMKGNYSAECFAEWKTESEGDQGSVRSKIGSVRSEKSSGSRLNLVLALVSISASIFISALIFALTFVFISVAYISASVFFLF